MAGAGNPNSTTVDRNLNFMAGARNYNFSAGAKNQNATGIQNNKTDQIFLNSHRYI
jgi:hypothetical protein